MTVEQIEARIAELEGEIRGLREEVWKLKGYEVIPGFGVVGQYCDDPDYAEAMRLGREWREQVNRESLEEFDREEAAAKANATPARKKPKPRKTDARS